MSGFYRIGPSELQAQLAAPDALLLDCRKLKDYQAEHIDSALHSHDALVLSLIKQDNKNRPLVIYCYHGHSSEHLAELFVAKGFTAVFNLEGGFERWKTFSSQAVG